MEEEDCASIEFLRRRLLSERCVSKAARQRAEELEKRVQQLQEQLNSVSLHRKRADEATSLLLSLLQNHAHLSDSDCESEISDDQPSLKVNDGGTSLSWKPNKDARYSIPRTRQTSFSSIASPKSAKSCRRIRPRQTRSASATEDLRVDDVLVSQTNAVSELHNCYDTRLSQATDSLSPNKDVERALQQQAHLIGRYQEEEKAQRDWEDRFRETNSCTQDTNEPGNQSDITEELYDIIVGSGAPIASENQNVVSGAIKVNSYQPEYACTGSKLEQRGINSHDYESVPSEEGIAKGKQAQKQSETYSYHPSSHDPHGSKGKLDSIVNQSAAFMSSSCHGGSSSSFSLRSQNENNGIVAYKPAVEIGGVLKALEAAKSSIEQRLGRLPPLLEGGSSSSSSRVGLDTPVGCAGLFRIPSDTKTNLLDSSDGVNFTTSYPVQTARGRMNFIRSLPSFMESRTNVFSSYGFMAGSPYREKVSEENASGYEDKYPRYPGFPDMKVGMQSSNEGIARSSVGSGIMFPETEQFTFNGGGVRPKSMHR